MLINQIRAFDKVVCVGVMAPQKCAFPTSLIFWVTDKLMSLWLGLPPCINTIILSNLMVFTPVLLPCLMLLLFSSSTKSLYKRSFCKEEKTQKHKFFSFFLFFLSSWQKIGILHNFSLECTSEKLAVLNLGELFCLNDLHPSRANLAFRSVVSSTTQLTTFCHPAAILLFFQQTLHGLSLMKCVNS